MRSFSGLMMGVCLVASTLAVSACGTAEAPTEAEPVVSPAPTISATPNSQPAPVAEAPEVETEPAPAAPEPTTVVAASTGNAVYPGTWLGLCSKLSDCDCSQWAEPESCSTQLSAGYEMGLEQAVAMGLPEEMLAQARMTPDKLSEIANESCPRICEAAAQFSAAMGGQATP